MTLGYARSNMLLGLKVKGQGRRVIAVPMQAEVLRRQIGLIW